LRIRQKLGDLWRLFFGDSARAFGSVSLLLLVSLAIGAVKEQYSPWRVYQGQYLRLVRARPNAAELQQHFQGGLQQIWLPEQDVVDRCTTCHVALQETSLTRAAVEPFLPHPPIPHALTEFGCVVCHRGQGAATTVEGAHGRTQGWDQPLLPAKYLESSCGQCHLAALPGTPRLNLGRLLLARNGCVRCHLVKQPDGTTTSGTDNPPSLVHIAEKTTREWIYAWIKSPQAYSATATMPDFLLRDGEALDLSAFLIAQSTPLIRISDDGFGRAGLQPRQYRPFLIIPVSRSLRSLRPQAAQGAGQKSESGDAVSAGLKPRPSASFPNEVIEAGAKIYGEALCASCHALRNTIQSVAGQLAPRNMGPDLARIGSKAKSSWLESWLGDPTAYNLSTTMPHYRFKAQQIALLKAFLETRTDPNLLVKVFLPAATPTQIAHGRILALERGCASCHEINGIKKPEGFAPELSRVGSKPLAQIAFAAGAPHALPDYLAGKIRNPRAFAPTLRMPRFRVTNEQIEALSTALLALTDRAQTQPATLRFVSALPSKPMGRASQIINDMRCFSCHPNKGAEGYIARDLTWEGSVVSMEWLEDFLRNPTRCGSRSYGARP
jgi:cbb3-type cytochrome oxidase cytochrome c subunit